MVGRKKQMIKYKGTTIYPPAMYDLLNDFSEIENYIIDGTGYGYCIYIGNTTEYYVIQNCHFYGSCVTTIKIYNSKNGQIKDNVLNGEKAAIDILNSSYLEIKNNEGAVIQLSRIQNNSFRSKFFDFEINEDELFVEKSTKKSNL